jgi:hypothetical protein
VSCIGCIKIQDSDRQGLVPISLSIYPTAGQ